MKASFYPDIFIPYANYESIDDPQVHRAPVQTILIMLLSKETTVKVTDIQSNIISHLGYAAYKLWNVCKYERDHWHNLGLSEYPDWYYQKRVHKDDIWFKSMPSQTAQEVCKILDKSYKSYHALLKSGGIEHPNAPSYKHDPMPMTYMQNGIAQNGEIIRLTLPKHLKAHMAERFDIHAKYLFLKNKIFRDMDHIKQIKLYMPKRNVCRVILVYAIPDPPILPDNNRYLSVDLGLHNLMTAYDSTTGKCMILGRKYSSIIHWYDKAIAHRQKISDSQQAAKGVHYPKMSKVVQDLYRRKRNTVHDLIHKCTRYIADYCYVNGINTVVIGNIAGIRKDNDLGHVINQKFHQLPYKMIYMMLQYKLALCGIKFVLQNEAYSSQTSPADPEVSKQYAHKANRRHRGLYVDNGKIYNADAVGAYNILRLYLKAQNSQTALSYSRLGCPVNAAV